MQGLRPFPIEKGDIDMSESESSASRQTAFEEIEVRINDVDSIEAEELLRNALKDLSGIRAVRIMRGGATISHNPDGISISQIRDVIERAGFTVDGIEGGRRSPERRGAEGTSKKTGRA
jgi:hypothetical protein